MLAPKRNRRGNATIVALSLIPLLGFGALSVDVGLQRMSNAQIQAAADAASLGGAKYLDGSSQGMYDALNAALAVGNANAPFVFGSWTLTGDEVHIGVWDGSTFTEVTDFDNYPAPGDVNAVRVASDHTHDSILAQFAFGVTELPAYGEATSVAPRGGVAKYVDCYLPIGIPVCLFDQYKDEDGEITSNPDPIKFILNTATEDNGAWALPMNQPTPGEVDTQLINTCANGTADTDMSVDVGNGQFANQLDTMSDIINGVYGDANAEGPYDYFDWPYSRLDATKTYPIIHSDVGDLVASVGGWGYTIAGVVPLIDAGTWGNGGDCSDASFTGNPSIVGWSYTYIYDVRKGGQDMGFFMQFDFMNDYDIGYGQCTGNCTGNVTGTFPAQMVY